MSSISTPSVSKRAETTLRTARLPEALQGTLKAAFDRSAQLLSAGWHGQLDIETLVGLEGQFLWSEEVFSHRTITFEFDPDKVGFDGTYKLVGGLSTVEQGTFHCVPNNPAIGFAFVALTPQGKPARFFTVAGMFTSAGSKIHILLLNKVADSGPPVQPPFSAVRIA